MASSHHSLSVAGSAGKDSLREALRVGGRLVLAAVKARTERFAMTPAERRSGRYEDVGAATSKSLDAAISTWVHATVDILRSRRGVSQAALQVAAGDAMILTATAGTVCAAARRLGLVDADRAAVATSALGAAHAAWRRPAAWPETVRLEGVRDPEHVHASRQLRKLVTDNLRQGRDWLPPERMADRFDMGLLLGTMRRGVHGVGNVALAHFQALDTLVRGRGRLWIDASAPRTCRGMEGPHQPSRPTVAGAHRRA